MFLQIFNRLRQISIKIEFGSPFTVYHLAGILIVGSSVCPIAAYNLYLQTFLGDAAESIVHLRRLNITHFSPLFYCDLPYDDYLCSILSNKSNSSENCIPTIHLLGSRILTLVSVFFQIFILHEIFSLNTVHRRVIKNALMMASIYTFIFITIIIHWSSCSHLYLTLILYFTGAPVCFLAIHNTLSNPNSFSSPSYNNQSVVVDKWNRNRTATRAQQELP